MMNLQLVQLGRARDCRCRSQSLGTRERTDTGPHQFRLHQVGVCSGQITGGHTQSEIAAAAKRFQRAFCVATRSANAAKTLQSLSDTNRKRRLPLFVSNFPAEGRDEVDGGDFTETSSSAASVTPWA